MKRAAVSQLKASLSEFLGRVKAGEEVVVTDRGRPIAKLVPIRPAEFETDDLTDLQKQGLIRLGKAKLPRGFWSLPRPDDRKGSLRLVHSEERERGW